MASDQQGAEESSACGAGTPPPARQAPADGAVSAGGPALVVDLGSCTIKAGFAGDDAPSTIFPNIVGRPKKAVQRRRSNEAPPLRRGDSLVGIQAAHQSSNLSLKYPVERGVVTNWDDMEIVWRHSFAEELGVEPENQAILLTEPPLNPKASRERTTQVMFETFSVPALYLTTQAVLVLRAVSRTTGVVVDSGGERSVAMPVYEGYVMPHAVRSLDLGGNDLTEFMARSLGDRSAGITTEVAREVKEQCSHVALDYNAEMEAARTSSDRGKSYTLVDSSKVTVGSERFRVPEALFKPGFARKEGLKGLHVITHQSIMLCDEDIRSQLFANVVLSGGNMMFPGIADRLASELTTLCRVDSVKATVDVVAPPKRKYLAWLGGSSLCAEPYFPAICVSREEYDNLGPSVVHIKCF